MTIKNDLLNSILNECYDKEDDVLIALIEGVSKALDDNHIELDNLKRDAALATSQRLWENFGALLNFPQGANITLETYRSQLRAIVNGAVQGATVSGILSVFDGLGLSATIYEKFRYSQLEGDLFKFSVNVTSFGSYTQSSLESLVRRFRPAHTVLEGVTLGGVLEEGADRCYSALASSELATAYSDSFVDESKINTGATTAYWKSANDLFQLEEGEI